MHTGQRQDTPHGTEEIRRAPEERFKNREIPERWFSDDAYDENWRAYVGYDPTHLPVEEGPEPGPEQMTRMGIELPAHRSSMICFMLPEDVARAVEEQVRGVVGDEAEPWNKLHVTLCVFDTPPDQDGADLVAEIARKVCAEYGPVSLRFTGIAQFESSDGVFPTVATVTGNGLAALRTDLVRAMEDAGIPVRTEYDLLPHCTLAYLSDQELAISPPTAEWTAEFVDVVTAQDALRGAQSGGWPQPVCVVCGAPAGAEQPCSACQRHHRRILEMRPELSVERAWEVLHKIHKDVGEKLEREQSGRTAQELDACVCGHGRSVHRDGRGLCFQCYDASDHGLLPYCQRFRWSREAQASGDWWGGASYQQQLDYLKQHPKTRKKPTKGKDPREEKAEPGTIEPAPSVVKVTQADVEGWHKDMRQMTKLYKELVAAIPEPAAVWRMEPEERAEYERKEQEVGKQYLAVSQQLGTFTKKLREWARNVVGTEDSHLAGEVRAKAHMVGHAVYRMVPDKWAGTGELRTPNFSEMRQKWKPALAQEQEHVREALRAVETYVAEKGGELERPPVVERFEQDGVQFEIAGPGRTPELTEQARAVAQRVGDVRRKLDKSGLGKLMEGLTIRVTADPAEANLGHAAATYDKSQDVVRMLPGTFEFATSPDDWDGNLIHELGHRLYFRMMTDQAVQGWRDELSEMAGAITEDSIQDFVDRYLRPAAEKREFWWYEEDAIKAQAAESGDPVAIALSGHLPSYEAAASPEGAAEHFKKFLLDERVYEEPISEYAKTNAEEAFAEAIRIYVNGPKGEGKFMGDARLGPRTRAILQRVVETSGMRLSAEQRLLAALGIEADWFDDLPYQKQVQYKKEHPKSKKQPGTSKKPSGKSLEEGKPEAPGPKGPSKSPVLAPDAPLDRPPPGQEIDVKPLPPGVDLDDFKLRVDGEQATEVAAALREGIERAADLCQISPPICTENLGIERKDMPQLAPDVIEKFIGSLKAKGIGVEDGTEHVGRLKATQKEIDAGKVTGMVEAVGAGKFAPQDAPIVVSRDGFVLDGHHRWAALLVLNPDNQMKVRKVDMDAKDLVDAANSFEGVEQRGFGAARLLASLGFDAYTDERGWERNSDGQREHRRVMEEKLDRSLKKSEDVHHKNEDKSDNRPSNLEVIDHAEHTREHKTAQAEIACDTCGIEIPFGEEVVVGERLKDGKRFYHRQCLPDPARQMCAICGAEIQTDAGLWHYGPNPLSETVQPYHDRCLDLSKLYARKRLLATLDVSAAEADFNLGDEVTLQETMLGLRQGDVGEVVGVQGYMIGVVFEDHPQAVMYVDKDLIAPAPEEPEEEGGEEPEEGGDFGPMEPQARLLAALGIDEWWIEAQARWWSDLTPTQQRDYLQDHPRSKLKPTETKPVKTPEGKELAPGEMTIEKQVELWNVRGALVAIPQKRKWLPKLDHLPEDLKKAYWDGDEPKPERKELVDRIIEEHLKGVEPVPPDQKPTVIFTMGGASSGKSTSFDDPEGPFKKLGLDKQFVVSDPDRIKGYLPEYLEAIGDPKYLAAAGKEDTGVSAKNAARMAHWESKAIESSLWAESLRTRRNTIVDGTGSDLEGMKTKIQKFKDAGYHVQLLMTDLDADLAKPRVSARAERTGRFVPMDVVDDQFATIPGNFEELAEMADDFSLFDATPEYPAKPVLMYERFGGKTDTYDEDWLKDFRDKATKSRERRKGTVDSSKKSAYDVNGGTHERQARQEGQEGSATGSRSQQAAQAERFPGCAFSRRRPQEGACLQGRRGSGVASEGLTSRLRLLSSLGATCHNPSTRTKP